MFDAAVNVGVDWQTVDRALRGIALRRAGMDAEEARWLRAAESCRPWKHLGMVSAIDYMERVLGYGPKTAHERLRVARALGALPELSAALAAGALTFSAVRELTRVAVPETEVAWRDEAIGKNLRQIEELVAEHKLGDRPQDPPDPEVRTRIVRFELAAQTFALMRQAQRQLNDEHGRHLSEDELMAAFCSAVLDNPPRDDETACKADLADDDETVCDGDAANAADTTDATDTTDTTDTTDAAAMRHPAPSRDEAAGREATGRERVDERENAAGHDEAAQESAGYDKAAGHDEVSEHQKAPARERSAARDHAAAHEQAEAREESAGHEPVAAREEVPAHVQAAAHNPAAARKRGTARSDRPADDAQPAQRVEHSRVVRQTRGGSGRAKYQIALTLCERCRHGWQEAAGSKIAIGPAMIDRALCDAQHCGSIDGTVPERAYQDVAPSVARLVWRRDHGRCRVPGCRSSRGVEIHHLIHRADGGGHDASNLLLLCSACHQAHHAGTLTITGTAERVEVMRPGLPRGPGANEVAKPGPHVGRAVDLDRASTTANASHPGATNDISHADATTSTGRRGATTDIGRASTTAEIGGPSATHIRPSTMTNIKPSATADTGLPRATSIDHGRATAPARDQAPRGLSDQRSCNDARDDRRSRLERAELCVLVRTALVSSGWKPGIAQKATVEADAALCGAGTLEQLTREALRRCPMQRL